MAHLDRARTDPDEHEHDYPFDEPDPTPLVDHPDDIEWPHTHDLEADAGHPVEHPVDHPVDQPEPDQVLDAVDQISDIDASAEPVVDEEQDIEWQLLLAELSRNDATPLEPTDTYLRRIYQWEQEAAASPVTRERMIEINEITQTFFESRFVDSWGRDYLTGRFGIDLAGHEHFRPGQAPAGWTNLVDHLRHRGVSDAEMVATGVATTASTGRLIDRFRDRVMFPVVHNGEVLGFVGRRRPDLTEADQANGRGGPKYLNTADTPLFHKGAQLYGVLDELLAEGAVPVIVEGPMDAIAVTLASAGRYLGVAPLGTSLTHEQASQLATIGRDPIVATDADLAGQVAAERDFWMLTPHGLDPGYARFPEGLDPADLLAHRGPAALTAALASGQTLGDQLLSERLDNLAPEQARVAAMRVLAARPSRAWAPGTNQVSARLQLSQLQSRRDLRDAVKTWDADPRKAAQAELNSSSEVRARLEAAAAKSPAERWAPLARELDPRLVEQGDWPATAAMLQQAHDHGHDVSAATRALIAETPLGDSPARDLRYRIVSRLDFTIDTSEMDTTPTQSPGATRDRQQPGSARPPRRGTPRR